ATASAAAQGVGAFAAAELEFRRSFFSPPFCEMASVLVSSPVRERAEEAAGELGSELARQGAPLRMSGPAPAPLERLLGRWRFQILLRAPDRRAVLSALEAAIPE